MNRQREGSKTNVHQVRQVQAMLLKYRLPAKEAKTDAQAGDHSTKLYPDM